MKLTIKQGVILIILISVISYSLLMFADYATDYGYTLCLYETKGYDIPKTIERMEHITGNKIICSSDECFMVEGTAKYTTIVM